jgi:hypothetical protein
MEISESFASKGPIFRETARSIRSRKERVASKSFLDASVKGKYFLARKPYFLCPVREPATTMMIKQNNGILILKKLKYYVFKVIGK